MTDECDLKIELDDIRRLVCQLANGVSAQAQRFEASGEGDLPPEMESKFDMAWVTAVDIVESNYDVSDCFELTGIERI